MAEDTSNGLILLEISLQHLDQLGVLRQWKQLELAIDNDIVWVKGFGADQAEGMEVRSIPYKKLFRLRAGLLFPYGKLTPEKQLSPELSWMPIEKALPLRLPALNHNYFSIADRLSITLKPALREREVTAILIPVDVILAYAGSAAAVRLANLRWVVIEDDVLVLGTPLLPLPGKAFWVMGNHFFPAGWELELELLSDILQQKLSPDGRHWLIWDEEGRYIPINKGDLKPLSRSSLRQTFSFTFQFPPTST